MEKLVYSGPTKPFIYIPNYGNVNLEDGDVFQIDMRYDSVNLVRLPFIRMKLGNFVSYPLYDFPNDEIEFLKEILAGSKLTPLEFDNKCIEQIVAKLPKKDFIMTKYQFTTDFRPTMKISFLDDFYQHRIFGCGYDVYTLAKFIYRNMFKILPDNVTECSAELFEELEYLYDYESF